MKEGWTYKKFGEVCSYHKEQGSFQNLPYVGMEHMESCTGKLLGTISSNSVLSSSFKFNKGEILYGRLRPYLKKVYVAEFDGCCSTEVFPINSDSIEPGFIKYWFLSDKITNMVNKTSAGCRMPRGNMNEVKNFLIGFPEDRKEQKRIVKRLDSAFENIDKLKANAEKQLSEAQTLFQKSLAKAMEPKEGWEEKLFGDVCYYNKEHGEFKDMKYLGMEHMESGTGRILGTMSSNAIVSSSFKFTKGDVLYGRLRPYLKKVYVAEFDGCCSTEVFPIRSEVVDANFIKYWLLTDEITNKINATSAGCRMPRGNMNEVKKFQFSYPIEKSIQQRIVERLDSLSENVRKYEEIQRQMISECDALKQALLRKVFE